MKIKDRQRVFLALPLSEGIREGIQRFRDQHADLEQPGFRWLPLENLHITLFFLGDVRLEEITRLCDDLRPVISESPPLQLVFRAFSLQPRRNPRMIWANLEPQEPFTALVQRIASVCGPYLLEQPRHEKEPIPHVTLARLKRFSGERVLRQDIQLPPYQATRAELWMSELCREGVVYSALTAFELAPG